MSCEVYSYDNPWPRSRVISACPVLPWPYTVRAKMMIPLESISNWKSQRDAVYASTREYAGNHCRVLARSPCSWAPGHGCNLRPRTGSQMARVRPHLVIRQAPHAVIPQNNSAASNITRRATRSVTQRHARQIMSFSASRELLISPRHWDLMHSLKPNCQPPDAAQATQSRIKAPYGGKKVQELLAPCTYGSLV